MIQPPFAPGDRKVPWLDRCASDWTFKPIKYLCTINGRVLGDNTDPGFEFRYVDIGSVNADGQWEASEPMQFENAPSRARRIVADGDVLISTVRTYLRAITHIPKVNESLVCSTGFVVISANGLVDSKFLAYWVRSVSFVDEVVARSVGVSYPAVNASDIGNLPFPLLENKHQRAIAAFLDRETTRIDALIVKKQRQIELLQEKRAALIGHAVTKGLDPNVKMKDSGVEWLGEIPEHWEVRKLKYLIEGSLVNGLFKKKEFFGLGTKLVNVFDVYREDFLVDHESLERVEADEVERQKYGVQPGDIFFVRSSLKLEGVGRSVCAMNVPETTVFECHVVRARPVQKTISPTFLIHFLNSIPAINRFISLANLVTMATIDQDRIKSLEVPLPPRDEQDRIMAVLDRDGARTEKLERKIANSIEKLREYRTALITAAVTGKINVQGSIINEQ